MRKNPRRPRSELFCSEVEFWLSDLVEISDLVDQRSKNSTIFQIWRESEMRRDDFLETQLQIYF